MKDYYYILGVTQQSSTEEIKKAYRKLSLKFHPDKNDGDPFFTERFRDIQEAYEVLSATQRRQEYDNSFQTNHSQPRTENHSNNFQPVIEKFIITPQAIYDGDEVTISWEVYNSDKVEIDKLGVVPLSGTKRIKVNGMKSNKDVLITICALNSSINKFTTQKEIITNKAYLEIRATIEEEIRLNKSRNVQVQSESQSYQERNGRILFIFALIVAVVTVVAILLN